MKVKFEFNYAQISTIHDALSDYLINLKDQCERLNKPDLFKESVAFELYCEFRKTIEEMEGNENK